MDKLTKRYVIGTHVMWFEIDMYNDFINGMVNLLETVENKEDEGKKPAECHEGSLGYPGHDDHPGFLFIRVAQHRHGSTDNQLMKESPTGQQNSAADYHVVQYCKHFSNRRTSGLEVRNSASDNECRRAA